MCSDRKLHRTKAVSYTHLDVYKRQHYDWKEQGKVADYVIIMGYDEHYGGSQEPGSVASIGYVEEGISTMVQSVPPEKVINAVPFYLSLIHI